MYDVNFDPFSVLARKATDEIIENYISDVSDKIDYIINNAKIYSKEKLVVR